MMLFSSQLRSGTRIGYSAPGLQGIVSPYHRIDAWNECSKKDGMDRFKLTSLEPRLTYLEVLQESDDIVLRVIDCESLFVGLSKRSRASRAKLCSQPSGCRD
jgi:hypothetical protein